MRATISFEIDLENVEDTMGMLAAQEAHNLRAAADLLEDYSDARTPILEEVTAALQLLDEAARQLSQYQQMLVSFEQAKYKTNLPQPVDGQVVKNLSAVHDTVEKMQQFDSFLSKIPEEEGVKDVPEDG
jgi:septation ring formation regulator EzrA